MAQWLLLGWGEQTPPSTASVPLNLSCLSMALWSTACRPSACGFCPQQWAQCGSSAHRTWQQPQAEMRAGLPGLSRSAQDAGPAGSTRTLPSVFMLITMSHFSPAWHTATVGSPRNLQCQCSAVGRTGCEERAWKGVCPMQGSTLLGIGSGGEKRLVPLVLGGKSFLAEPLKLEKTTKSI